MMCQVVINDENVTTGFHEVFRDTGRSIGSDVGESGGVVPCDDDDGVFHRFVLAQNRNGFGHC